MWMTVGEHRFAITLADNTTARAFCALLPLTLDMSELNGNENFLYDRATCCGLRWRRSAWSNGAHHFQPTIWLQRIGGRAVATPRGLWQSCLAGRPQAAPEGARPARGRG